MGSHDPISASATQRAKEFPSENLTISASKLFCSASREELSLKLSIIRNLIKSEKHRVWKDNLLKRESKQRDIASALQKHDIVHPQGENVPINHQVRRVRVVQSFLKAGVPLKKVGLESCWRNRPFD